MDRAEAAFVQECGSGTAQKATCWSATMAQGCLTLQRMASSTKSTSTQPRRGDIPHPIVHLESECSMLDAVAVRPSIQTHVAPLQRPGSEARDQDGNVQKEWSYSQAEHSKPDGWWHPFMIADGPMRSRALATSPGDACTSARISSRCPLNSCCACHALFPNAMALLTLTGPKMTRISCHHLCNAQDAFPVHALLCRCPSMCRSMIRPRRSLAASCSSGACWTTLSLQRIAHQRKALQWQCACGVGRAPVTGPAWWSGGPLFDVKTGKVMVCAAAAFHPVRCLQHTTVTAQPCPKLS